MAISPEQAEKANESWGKPKSFDVCWRSNLVERIVAHVAIYPSSRNSSGESSAEGHGHIQFRSYVDGITRLVLSVAESEIKWVRQVSDAAPKLDAETETFWVFHEGRSVEFGRRYWDRAIELLKYYGPNSEEPPIVLANEMHADPPLTSLPFVILKNASRFLREEGYDYHTCAGAHCVHCKKRRN